MSWNPAVVAAECVLSQFAFPKAKWADTAPCPVASRLGLHRGNPEMPWEKTASGLTLTKTEKKRSLLSSCTLLEAIFRSLQ